jgi:hypothetical protein
MKYQFLILAICLSCCLSAQTPKGAAPIYSPSGKQGGAIRAVVIGISDYQDPNIPDLRFADRDAEAFSNYLRSPAGGSVPEAQISILTNQKATAGNIIAALTGLVEDSKPGDRVIFSFSGHGDVEKVTKSQWGYLLAAEGKTEEAIGYVEQAIGKGATMEQLEKDEDLAPLREQKEQWEALMKKYFPEKAAPDPAKGGEKKD